MSRENLEQFMNQIAGSEELQAKIGEEIDTESLIALGAECGCEFTPEDLLFAAQLSEEELESVAHADMQSHRLAIIFSASYKNLIIFTTYSRIPICRCGGG